MKLQKLEQKYNPSSQSCAEHLSYLIGNVQSLSAMRSLNFFLAE